MVDSLWMLHFLTLKTFILYNFLFNVFSEALKEKVKQNVKNAFQAEEVRSRQFGNVQVIMPTEPAEQLDEERPQPSIFRGKLKHYQLKGMNWLANLYDQVRKLSFGNVVYYI